MRSLLRVLVALLLGLTPVPLHAFEGDAPDDYCDYPSYCGSTPLLRRFITPGMQRGLFTSMRQSAARRNMEDNSIWEKDTARHGGEQWKRWDDEKDWEKGRKPMSIWPDGRIRKDGE